MAFLPFFLGLSHRFFGDGLSKSTVKSEESNAEVVF